MLFRVYSFLFHPVQQSFFSLYCTYFRFVYVCTFFQLPVYPVLLESLLSKMLSIIFPAWDLANGKQMIIIFYLALYYVEGFCINYLI